jgi:hypothetical protein
MLAEMIYMEEHTNFKQLEDANDRPIIFLCHSLGGIIVKRASYPNKLLKQTLLFLLSIIF